MRVVFGLLVVVSLLLGERALSAPTDQDEIGVVGPDSPSNR